VILFLGYRVFIQREKDHKESVAGLQERNDLLVVALGRRSETEINFPVPPPKVLEESTGWWDRKPPKVEIKFPTIGA
jgi:hypothetical protein